MISNATKYSMNTQIIARIWKRSKEIIPSNVISRKRDRVLLNKCITIRSLGALNIPKTPIYHRIKAGDRQINISMLSVSLGVKIVFSQIFILFSYQLYLKLPNETPNPMYFLRTLQPELWYACLIIFIILSITLRLTIYIINNAYQVYQKKIMEPSLSFLTCFLMVLSGFLNQGVDLHLHSLAARTQFFVALLFGYTVYAAISAVLVAELAVSDYPLPFKSIDDVVEKGFSMCVRTNSFLYTQLEEKINKSTAWARYLNGPGCPRTQDISSIKRSICEKNAIFFESRAVMSKVILDPDWKCGLMIFGGNRYFRKANSLIFFKGFRQKRIIAWFIERVRGSGILQKLTIQWIRPVVGNLNVPTFNEVTFIHIEGILMLYGVSIIISFMIFVIEYLVYKFEKRQRL